MRDKYNILVAILLVWVAGAAFFSSLGDSTTMDEVAHIPAGYSYLTKQDMRLNPEHPPLVKDLAALPLLFQNLKFPSDHPSWTSEVNGQWNFGFHWLYDIGNDPYRILLLARIAPILILIFFGWFLYFGTSRLFNKKTALLALIFYSFSPTFLAHGRLVTTDVPAAAGVFIATYYFLQFLINPTKKNIMFAGIAFGLAELTKFSAILLIPFFGILIFFWIMIKSQNFWPSIKSFILYSKFYILILIIGFLLIGALYQFHVWNYTPKLQIRDIRAQIYGLQFLADFLSWMANIPILQAYSQYFRGLIMVFQRVAGGNTIYFMGEVSNWAWRSYFPIVYAIKEPLAFHILTIIALLFFALRIKEVFWKNVLCRLWQWIQNHFTEFSFLVFIGIYWATSISGNLNLGVRHLLPTLPFIYVLIANGLSGLMRSPRHYLIWGSIVLLLVWQIFSVASVYPHFLAYFNELAGGSSGGYRYVVDSNLDWGQDLKRLARFVEDNKIQRIKVGYFGGGKAQYYLGDRFEELKWGPKEKGWIAISATFLQGGRGLPRPGFYKPTGYFRWLDNYEPVEVIGNSIFIYYIPET